MGKASRNRAKRGSAGERAGIGRLGARRLVIVDSMEIGHRAGMVTLRMGLETDEPVRLVVPARQAASLVENLREARLDAEEIYWKQIVPRESAQQRQGMPFAAVLAERHALLLEQDWEGVIAATPGGGCGMFLVTFAGHVGLCAEAPYTGGRVLAIIDPLQLHRLSAPLDAALAQALAEDRTLRRQPVHARLLQVRRFLDAQPWPYQPAGYTDPTPQQAEAEMTRRYRDFLTRAPYQRAPEHDLPVGVRRPNDDRQTDR